MDVTRSTDEPALSIVESAEAARSQSEAAYLRIRDRIVSLDMPPGSVVQETGGATDQRELMRLDQRIHRQIYRAARNSFLESTLERYLNLSLRLWYLVLDREVRLREAVAEHVELLRAVLAGDGSRAEDGM